MPTEILPADDEPHLAQDNEVMLTAIQHETLALAGDAMEIYVGLFQSPIILGGLPTDPDYCFGGGTTGRSVEVTVLIDGQEMTSKTFCVSSRYDINPYSFNMQTGVPATLSTGTHSITFEFRTGDTGEMQFASQSSWTSSFEIPEGEVPDPGNGGCTSNDQCPDGFVCDNGDCKKASDDNGGSSDDERRKKLAFGLLAVGAGAAYLKGRE